MQTLNKERISKAFKIYAADKPFLARRIELFDDETEDMALYSAFTGSVHEVPSRLRRSKIKL